MTKDHKELFKILAEEFRKKEAVIRLKTRADGEEGGVSSTPEFDWLRGLMSLAFLTVHRKCDLQSHQMASLMSFVEFALDEPENIIEVYNQS